MTTALSPCAAVQWDTATASSGLSRSSPTATFCSTRQLHQTRPSWLQIRGSRVADLCSRTETVRCSVCSWSREHSGKFGAATLHTAALHTPLKTSYIRNSCLFKQSEDGSAAVYCPNDSEEMTHNRSACTHGTLLTCKKQKRSLQTRFL